MANHVKFCGCKACRAGRHRPGSKARTKRALRSIRRAVKTALRNDREIPAAVSIPYTD